MVGCPENSDDYLQSIDTTNAREKSAQLNCESVTKHLKIEEDVTQVVMLDSGFYDFHTFSNSIWVKISSTTQDDIPILSYGTLSG